MLFQGELLIIFILPFLPLFLSCFFVWGIYKWLGILPYRKVSHQFVIGLFLLFMAVVSFAIARNPLIAFIALPEGIFLLIVGFIVIIIGILNKRRIVASWDDDDDKDDDDPDGSL